MFYEHGSQTKREGWTYSYTGAELCVAASYLKEEFRTSEMLARNELADLMRNPSVSHSDEKVLRLREEIARCGKEHEACSVFALEFRRSPDREYHLGLGDVVYFGLNREEQDD